MKTTLNETLISKIDIYLPNNTKRIPFLMDLLNLSRESVYRRIRNEIPFTFEEITDISLKLGFSVDEVIGQNSKNRILFDTPISESSDPSAIYSSILDNSSDIYKRMQKDHKLHTIFTTNYLPLNFCIQFDELAKFHYYKWIHQTQDVPLNFYRSEFIIPSQISTIHKQYRYAVSKVNSMIVILCPNTIITSIKEIIYFYKRRLITRDEFLLLQNDLNLLIENLEISTQKGINENGTKIRLFYSTLNITSNCTWFNNGNETGVQLWLGSEPVNIYNRMISKKQQNWMESLLKYCTLISQSNEIQRSDFFNQQYEYIRNMENLSL